MSFSTATPVNDSNPDLQSEKAEAQEFVTIHNTGRYFPDDKLAVAVLTNLQGADPVTIAEGIAALYIPDLKKVF